MPGFKEIFAAKIKALMEKKSSQQAAAALGIPEERYADYQALKTMADSGEFPKSVQDAASAIAAAAEIARAQKLPQSVLGGSKDLPWPPGEAFKTPLGYAPYLPRFKEVLASIFPPHPAAAKPPRAAPQVAANKPPVDPMAAMRAMAQTADIKGGATPIAQDVLATSQVPETDDPEP